MSTTTEETITTEAEDGILARALKEADEAKAKHDHEISEALREEAGPLWDGDERRESSESDSELDDLEKQIAHREWTVKGTIMVPRRDGGVDAREFERVYVQKPLSFTAMLQFTGLIGERLSEAMSGPDGLTVDGIIGEGDGLIVSGRNVISREDFSSLDSFVKGLAKLAQYAPSIVEDCQCIWIRVPYAERPLVKEIWSRSPEDGGLTISEGREMLEVFLAQNYKEVEDFFVVQLPLLVKKVTKLRALAAAGSRRSKRSKPSQPTGPRR